MKRCNRRRFLQGMLGGAAITVGLPWLEVFHAHAQSGSAYPTRFALFCWGNGMLPNKWVPAATGFGDEWALSEQLAPLAAVKEKLSVLTGLAIKTPNVIPHHSGSAGILTGMPLLVKSHEEQTFNGPSIDQVIAAEIGNETRFRSLEFGAQPGRGLSHNGPDNVNPPITDPGVLFERIFGTDFRAPGDMSDPDPRLALRRSVLDAVMDDIQRFKRDLGVEDIARMDQHLQGVRELERRISRLEEDPPNLESCRRPVAPDGDYGSIEGRPQLSRTNRALCDIVALAMACDQTRVVSNFITKPLTNELLAGTNAGHHQLTHDEPDPQPQVNRIVLAIMEELGYFIQSLDGIPEGDGTLLDHMVLLATSDVSYGRIHSLDEFPVLIAGSANGRLKVGQHYRSELAENTSHAMLSIIRAAGANVGHFGDSEGRVEDGLGAIET